MVRKEKKLESSSSIIELKEIENFILENGSDDLPTFGGDFEGGCHCQQIYDEIAPFIFEVLNIGDKIKKYLEVGVASGGTTFILNNFFKFEKVVLIDDNKHPKSKFRKSILEGIPIKEMIGRSDEKRIIDSTKDIGPYDLIFIDGDHTFEAVNRDVNNYFPMIKKGGYIALHDSVMKQWGVHIVVENLKKDDSVDLFGEYVTGTKIRACGLTVFKKVI